MTFLICVALSQRVLVSVMLQMSQKVAIPECTPLKSTTTTATSHKELVQQPLQLYLHECYNHITLIVTDEIVLC